jgi:hypothetical protein
VGPQDPGLYVKGRKRMPRKMPEPKTLEAKRLEAARVRLGFNTVKSLAEALNRVGYDVSEQTVRNWHRGDRDAPTSYYGALGQFFGVRLPFLHFGIQPILKSEEYPPEWSPDEQKEEEPDTVFERMSAIVEEVGGATLWELAGSSVAMMYEELVWAVHASCHDCRMDSEEQLRAIARSVLGLCMEPVKRLNPQGLEPYTARRTYYRAMLLALTAAVPEEGENVSVSELVDSLGENHGTP